jgi:hypothetical protein
MKYVGDRPFATPETAARKLLEIVLSKDIDVGQYTYTSVTNTAFLQAGGNVAEYLADLNYAIAQGWLKTRPAGSFCCRRRGSVAAGNDPPGPALIAVL